MLQDTLCLNTKEHRLTQQGMLFRRILLGRVQLNVHCFDVLFFFLLSRFSSTHFPFFFKQRFEDMVTCFCYGNTNCTDAMTM